MGILLAILAAASFGVGRVFAGLGLQRIKPLTGTLISLISGLLLVLIVTFFFQFEALISVSLAAVGWFALIGILNFPVGRGLTFLGIRHIGASRSTTVYASYPLFTMALAIPLLGERVSAVLVIGVLFIVGGLTLLFSEREPEKKVTRGANRVAGYGFSLASAISYGATAVLLKWAVSGLASPLVGATVSLFFGTLALAAVAGRDLGASAGSNWGAVGFLALSGLASSLGVMFLYTALSLAPAVVATPLGATSPLFTLLGTYLFLRRLERLTYHVVVGCLMVVMGGVLVTTG
ncbi:MAG: DMT family transporter [Dehalococcoidia bacterium]